MKILLILFVLGLIKIICGFLVTCSDKRFLKRLEFHLDDFDRHLQDEVALYTLKKIFNFLRVSKLRYFELCGTDYMNMHGKIMSQYESILVNYKHGFNSVISDQIENVVIHIGDGIAIIKKKRTKLFKEFLIFPLYPLLGLNMTLKLIIESLGYDITDNLRSLNNIIAFLVTLFSYFYAFHENFLS
ncbi:hypothetical protein [Psychrilyobacter sp.]|uniref:hypothetical protein n=1 Tax=Psychrilyobacter sp. TaxID=2586924 RepID=UPI0030198786